jgi:hypothetical protein
MTHDRTTRKTKKRINPDPTKKTGVTQVLAKGKQFSKVYNMI